MRRRNLRCALRVASMTWVTDARAVSARLRRSIAASAEGLWRGAVLFGAALLFLTAAVGQGVRACPHHATPTSHQAGHAGTSTPTPSTPCSCIGTCHLTSAAPLPAVAGATPTAKLLVAHRHPALADSVRVRQGGAPPVARSPPSSS